MIEKLYVLAMKGSGIHLLKYIMHHVAVVFLVREILIKETLIIPQENWYIFIDPGDPALRGAVPSFVQTGEISMFFKKTPPDTSTSAKRESGKIRDECTVLNRIETRGELGEAVSHIILRYSPRDLQQMKRNFGIRIRDITPQYRDNLEMKIAEHLSGTWQTIRLMKQQGVFTTMHEPLTDRQKEFWNMVIMQCEAAETGEDAGLRFLKFLLAGFCMFVLREPGHAVGTPFPGGDTVECIDGIYYCPVRDKADDVNAALCPFCPALQTPEIGYLRPPLNASGHRKQEFIEHCHKFHNFNG